jgi:lipopolysaccharide export system permease protein
MAKIRWYILSNFFKTFLTIFIPLFFVISLVYVIKIASLTTKVEISFGELIEVFGYFIPMILFYTLPISFIASVSSMFFRLSQDNELVALFSLGIKASYIVRIIAYISIFISSLLLFLSLLVMPHSKYKFLYFKEKKFSEARLNILPNQLGQKFGNFFIYVKSKDKSSLRDVVIYNRDKNNFDQLFLSKDGEIKDNNGLFSLVLYNGTGYTYSDDTLKEIQYDSMHIYDNIDMKEMSFKNSLIYWSEAKHNNGVKRRLLFSIFSSFLPILTLYIIASFSIINARYQTNHSFLVTASISSVFYLSAVAIKQNANEIIFISSIILAIIASIFIFKKRISSFY